MAARRSPAGVPRSAAPPEGGAARSLAGEPWPAAPPEGGAARSVRSLTRSEIERDVARLSDVAPTDLFAVILPPGHRGLGVGRESGRLRRDGVSRHDDPYGSTRYLRSVGGAIVSGLQVMSRDGREAVIANVYTRPDFRGRGFAAELLSRARRDFAAVHHAPEEHLSADGRGWKRSVG